MARNICLDCGYFLNCSKASQELVNCERFVKVHKTITRIENEKGNNDKCKN